LSMPDQEGYCLVELFRKVVVTYLKELRVVELEEKTARFTEPGVFVSLRMRRPENKVPVKTICSFGYPSARDSIVKATYDAAIHTALYASRCLNLTASSLDNLIFDVDLIGHPTLVSVDKPINYRNSIEVGRHGILVEKGFFRSLILPRIAVENGWNSSELLGEGCMRAGFDADRWLDGGISIFKFETRSFSSES